MLFIDMYNYCDVGKQLIQWAKFIPQPLRNKYADA